MRHIIAVLMQNEAGALSRLAGLFSSRGYNIESLNVAATHDPLVSRLTLITNGDESVIEQINKQLKQLIDVVDVLDYAHRDHIECELALIKLRVNEQTARPVVECIRRYRGLILDETGDTRTVQMSGSGLEVNDFVDEIGRLGTILETVRSGVTAIEPGPAILALPSNAAA